MRTEPTGFMSEHTAEYALVRDLSCALRPHFQRVIPIFYWVTREGSWIAGQSMAHLRVRILGAYARRPKIYRANEGSVLVKVNGELFVAARTASALGIPILIGVPLVSGLADFSVDCACCWFRLTPEFGEQEDYTFGLLVGNGTPTTMLCPQLRGPLRPLDTVDLLVSHSRAMRWDEAAAAMRTIRSSSPVPMHFGGGYRPFFVAVSDA